MSRLLACAVFLLALPGSAQELFFDTVDVAVVNLEVVVTDRDGVPVTDLTRADFEVLEDGQPVEISNFFAVTPSGATGGPGTAADAADPAALPADTAATPLPLRRTERLSMVVVIDNLNVRPQNRNQHLEGLREWILEKLDPGDQVMLVTQDLGGVRIVARFTDDREALREAIAEVEKGQSAAGRLEAERNMLLRRMETAALASPDAFNPRDFEDAVLLAEDLARQTETLAGNWHSQVTASIEILGRFTDTLAGLPGRKALVYVSDGLPQHTGRSLAQGYLNKYEDWALTTNAQDLRDEMARLRTMANRPDLDIGDQLEVLVARAAANRVAFYPVARTTGGAASSVSAEFMGIGQTPSGAGPRSQDVVAVDRMDREASMIHLAGGTGGQAFLGTPSLGELIDRVESDFRTFYSIGYHAPRPTDTELHEIEVRVRGREDLVVRHPEQIRRKSALEALEDLTVSSLRWNAESNPLQVTLEAGQATSGEKKGIVRMPLLVKIPFEKILLLPEEGAHAGRLTVMVAVEDPESGNQSAVRRVDLPIKIPNDQLVAALGQTAATEIQLELREGPTRISVGVHDHLAQMDSAIRIDLEVEQPG